MCGTGEPEIVMRGIWKGIDASLAQNMKIHFQDHPLDCGSCGDDLSLGIYLTGFKNL
jgi:hypothetical protein